MEHVYTLELQTLLGPLFTFDSLLNIPVFQFLLCLKHPRKHIQKLPKIIFVVQGKEKLVIRRAKKLSYIM